MNGGETANPAKWSRNAAVANFGAAGFAIFASIFMWHAKVMLAVFSIAPPPWLPSMSAGTFYIVVFTGGVLAAIGGVLSWKRKYYIGAIIITIISFILAGNFFSLLALAFLLAAKGEFARKVGWKL